MCLRERISPCTLPSLAPLLQKRWRLPSGRGLQAKPLRPSSIQLGRGWPWACKPSCAVAPLTIQVKKRRVESPTVCCVRLIRSCKGNARAALPLPRRTGMSRSSRTCNAGRAATHGNSSSLGGMALVSGSSLSTVGTVQAAIKVQLAAQAATGALDPCALSVSPLAS
jgi:hypothetical protein